MAEKAAITLNSLAEVIHETNVKNGFWEGIGGEQYEIPRKIALAHGELAEALDEHHRGKDGWESRLVEELADTVIRIFDLAEHYHPGTIGNVLIEKVNYNLSRPFKHGKRY